MTIRGKLFTKTNRVVRVSYFNELGAFKAQSDVILARR